MHTLKFKSEPACGFLAGFVEAVAFPDYAGEAQEEGVVEG